MNYEQATGIARFTEEEQQELGIPAQLTLLELYNRHAEVKTALLRADGRLSEAMEVTMLHGGRFGNEYQAAGEASARLTPVLFVLEVVITEIEDVCLRGLEG